MRILYYINLDLAENKGVLQKITDQITIWEEKGHSVLVVSLSPSVELKNTHIKFHFFPGERSRFYGENFFKSIFGTPPQHYKELIAAAKMFNPDLIYFRDIFNLYIIRSFIHGFSCPKVYEANTIDKSQVQSGTQSGLKKYLNLIYFNLFTSKILKRLDGAVAVTGEIAKVIGKSVPKVCVIPNGIHYREIVKPLRNNSIPNIVFIGAPGLAWHGVDKIVDLAGRTNDKLCFHIIGYTRPNSLTADNIIFYGNMEHKHYEHILMKADVAISSAAVYRKKINEGSGLKVREYLLYKLPVILPYKETIFDKEYDFVLQLPNSEDSLASNVEKIVAFCRYWLNRQLDTSIVKPMIDSRQTEARRLDFFQELVNAAKK